MMPVQIGKCRFRGVAASQIARTCKDGGLAADVLQRCIDSDLYPAGASDWTTVLRHNAPVIKRLLGDLVCNSKRLDRGAEGQKREVPQ